MKKYSLALSFIIISVLSGCGGGNKNKQKNTQHDSLAMPLSGDKKETTMLSFFDDEEVKAFDDVETFVLDEDSAKSEKATRVAKADTADDSFTLQEPSVDQEKCIVYFDYDSNGIRADQKTSIVALRKQIRKWIKQGYKVVFRGHSCHWSPKADSVYNMILSNDRARSLADSLGVAEDKRTIVGLGYEEPMVIEDVRTKEGQAANRRVEVYPITV